MWRPGPGVIAGLLVLAGTAFAVDPERALSQFVRERWGVTRGFPRGAVYAVTQTRDGYLWIGSEVGLLRFDGWNFQLMPGNSNFTGSAGLGLLPDRNSNLWMRVHGPRMVRFRDGAFDSPLSGLPYSNITAMSLSNTGELLAAAPEQGVVTYRDGQFLLLAATDSLPRSPVISLAQTANGDLWMGTRDAGLYRLNGKTIERMNDGLPDPKVNFLLPDKAGGLWAATDDGIAHWDGKRLRTIPLAHKERRLQVLSLVEDRDGNLWVGTHSGALLRRNAKGVEVLENREGFSGAVTALFEDREGNLWIGRDSGIERLRDSAFVTYSEEESLPANGNTPILVDQTKRLWFGAERGGVWWLEDGRRGQVRLDGLDGDVAYSLAEGPNEIWVGRRNGGLTQLRRTGESILAKTFTTANGLAQNGVYSVYRGRDGRIWAGTLSGGVSVLEHGQFRTYTAADGLGSNTVTAILEGREGGMWFGTPAGLSEFRGGKWKTYAAPDGRVATGLNCLLEDSQGMLWAGTAGGLAYLSGERFQVGGKWPDVLREPVLGLAEDRLGYFWLTTSNHVLRIRRESLLGGRFTPEDVREFTTADGLRGTEGIRRHLSVTSDSRGRIWFSLNRGISFTDPGRLRGDASPAIAQIGQFAVDGIPQPLNGVLQVPHEGQRITIGYAGLSLSVPERVRYRSWMVGFDKGWNEPMTGREAVYTNLGPGTYRFRVIASNPDGAWNGPEASISFEILPAFYQTSTFRGAAFLTAMGAVLVYYRLRMRTMAERLSLRFEERLAERTRIAQELHDTLLQGFLSASMQLYVAAESLPENSPGRPPLDRVMRLISQVIEEGRNAVRGLRSTGEGKADLAQAFSKVEMELGITDGPELQVVVEGEPQALHPIIRDEIYRIGREALVNAFRHSQAKQVELELSYTASHFRLQVRDNGAGIDAAVLQSGREGHWGLSGMRERAERIGGQFHLWSRPGAGTEVEISIPSRTAFAGQPSSPWWARVTRLVFTHSGSRPEPTKERTK